MILSCSPKIIDNVDKPGVTILLIDTDRERGEIKKGIYGQFLEHINHSVSDGLFAEQIQGQGFEGNDFRTFWKVVGDSLDVYVTDYKFKNGEKSVRITTEKGSAGLKQNRIYIREGVKYDGSVWLKPEEGSLQVLLQVRQSDDSLITEIPLKTQGMEWQEVPFSFSCVKTDTQAVLEILATGNGSLLVDFISLMRAEIREKDMLRPDLVKAIGDLKPDFIRWPGGSFASIYQWEDGIGPLVSRKYHPNDIWGGYSDYYGFGTDEFMTFCSRLNAKPLIVLKATSTNSEEVKYAMDWVHYLNDPPTTKWGKLRADNGHPEPYRVEYFQIDNEPMNHGLTPEQYAEIVNIYGSNLRKIAPTAQIIACGQKRSNDMNWSEKIIDMAGENFDILGCHNYEYENENFQSGLQRISDYLIKLRDYIKISKHPEIKMAVLEWSLCRTYDWRAGLHTAGSLIMYEKLSPELEMTCPALLLRNTTDDPTWTAFIYHDHVSWFPGSGYIVEKLFREHYAERYLASASGTFRDIEDRNSFFENISTIKPEDWKPGTFDAIASAGIDGKRIIIKAVNYENKPNLLLARLQGALTDKNARINIYTINAGLNDAPAINQPDKIKPIISHIDYSRNLEILFEPYSVKVIEIKTE